MMVRPLFARTRQSATIGGALVTFLGLFALFGPGIAASGPNDSDFAHGVGPHGAPAGPSAAHWLGTDVLFRDEFARLAHGARLSLLIAVCATAVAMLVGTAVGIVAGYYEGRRWKLGPVQVGVDDILMRGVDVGLSFPFLLLVMAIGSAIEKTNLWTILLILGLTSWLGTARIVRAKTIQIRALDYIVASRALGQSTPMILLRHILPNLSGPVIVIASITVAQMILAESVLSYLSLGIAPPTSTWGRMLYEGQERYMSAPWLAIAPGAAIVAAVLGFNLLGEGLRDALDPKGRS